MTDTPQFLIARFHLHFAPAGHQPHIITLSVV
jgi:hypothetical protein